MCCEYSNVTLGTSYANLRNETSQFKFSFEDFTLLAKVISLESGSDFVPVEISYGVGEVVLNRVASPEFPNSIREVLLQEGQYSTAPFLPSVMPDKRSVEVAFSLLTGYRIFNCPTVVYQSNFPELGSEVHSQIYVEKLGYTYFAHSYYPQKYGGN
ncbi:MAG: cell wall hydrolase [Spirochaetia bacterium]|nr:cell wall hydrolase [Spirochaetia bacterium]